MYSIQTTPAPVVAAVPVSTTVAVTVISELENWSFVVPGISSAATTPTVPRAMRVAKPSSSALVPMLRVFVDPALNAVLIDTPPRMATAPAGMTPSVLATPFLERFDAAVSDDLNTAVALTVLEEVIALKKVDAGEKLAAIAAMDAVLGLGLLTVGRADLRIRPKAATISEAEIEAILANRKEARAAKDFAASDALRDELAAAGVEVMDGDPLGWDWKLG